ncbi:hypothetical protein [Pelagibius sp. Alg239-R121]|uniref:hypothetical protein n=1 Tax=Pelagibius sp. Alg239-R121 TaxID=2993448 RepID=UPI0024A61C61|nr:hypothetical protein [Pelagibius sp. Alg239-R121]
MEPSILENFVERACSAAACENPTAALRSLLEESISDKTAMAEAIARQPDDEVLIFENETCSIWTCRYHSDVVLPPHEHLMTVHIAVYRGNEVEILYHRDADRLRHAKNRVVLEGEVVSLGPDAVHAVTAEGDMPSYAIHIYEGATTQVTRSLFDWTSGGEIEFTMANFHAMLRKPTDVEELQ